MKAGESSRFTQKQVLCGACISILLLVGLLFGAGVLELAQPEGRKPGHASTRIQKILEPFPVSEQLQSVFEGAYKSSGEEDLLNSESQAKLKYAQRILMQVLLLNEIESMVDLGCGPLTWLEPVLKAYQKEDPKFRYLGLDVARQLVERHKERYKDHPAMAFEVFDATLSIVPDNYELVFSRELLQHLPLVAAVDVLEKVAQSSARLFLVHTYKTLTPQERNKNIKAGEYYDINLMSDPFNLVDPLAVYDENTYQLTGGTQPDRHMFLYSVDQLKKVDFVAMRQRAHALTKEA